MAAAAQGEVKTPALCSAHMMSWSPSLAGAPRWRWERSTARRRDSDICVGDKVGMKAWSMDRARVPSRLFPSASVTSTSTCNPTDGWRGAPQSGDSGVGRRELAVMGTEVAVVDTRSEGRGSRAPPPLRLKWIDGGATAETAAASSRCWAPSSDGGQSRVPPVLPLCQLSRRPPQTPRIIIDQGS
uniref:Uncharacterized protein n=1 Tax=Oryza glumipatula TaxID=40148 RepID=A0A0D9YS57_9ORYZ